MPFESKELRLHLDNSKFVVDQTSDPQDVKYSGIYACDNCALSEECSSMKAPNCWEASKKSITNSYLPLPMNLSKSTPEIGAQKLLAQAALSPPLTSFEGQQYEEMSFPMLQFMRPHSHFQFETIAVECNMLSAQQIKEYTTPSNIIAYRCHVSNSRFHMLHARYRRS